MGFPVTRKIIHMINRPKDKWYTSMTDGELNSFYNQKLAECSNDIMDLDERATCNLHISEYKAEIKYREEAARLDREIKEAIAEGIALKEEIDNTKGKVKALNSFGKGQK